MNLVCCARADNALHCIAMFDLNSLKFFQSLSEKSKYCQNAKFTLNQVQCFPTSEIFQSKGLLNLWERYSDVKYSESGILRFKDIEAGQLGSERKSRTRRSVTLNISSRILFPLNQILDKNSSLNCVLSAIAILSNN